ncbi:hypothetical protein [Cyclobacterium plantarum]|uniref:DUF5723 domain-containing protein n=1 Tax=Cyclobacterium plantarum TaxID=2716263 RepID=A0ABX0HD65_9BACT|nr:hypothetical protein [Cyclobacterium plantarum]NHE58427.1 hypothetical protein [Cyclobacterium plantarum]
MKKSYCLIAISSGFALLFGLFEAAAQENRPAHLGFLYPISTNGVKAADYTNDVSIHALTGLSGGERGLAIYGLGGLIQGDATGFQTAGLWLSVSGELKGAQVAGLINQAQQASKGIQIAGLVNRSREGSGSQLAGITNSTASLRGAQLSGIANFSQKVEGIQLSGIMNQAEEVNGIQISGLVNKAKTVRGVQLSGLINIADSSDYPIGIINLIANGEKRIGFSVDENLTQLLSFRSGGDRMYGIIGLGSNFSYDDLPYAMETGIGFKLTDSKRFRLDMEASNLWGTNFRKWGGYSKTGLRILPVLKLSRSLQLYAGPSLNYMNTEHQKGSDLAQLRVWERHRSNSYKAIHWGVNAGLQLTIH